MNSTRLAVMTATRSPAPTPRAAEVTGEGVAEAVEVAERPVLVAAPDGGSIPESERGPLEGFVHQDRVHWKHSSLI